MKTYEECCDEVAKKYNKYSGIPYKDWSDMEKSLGSIRSASIESLNNLFSRFEEAAILYAQELVGEAIVLARTNHKCCGIFNQLPTDDSKFEVICCGQFDKYTEQEIMELLSQNK